MVCVDEASNFLRLERYDYMAVLRCARYAFYGILRFIVFLYYTFTCCLALLHSLIDASITK
jgi:hypothetical protein